MHPTCLISASYKMDSVLQSHLQSVVRHKKVYEGTCHIKNVENKGFRLPCTQHKVTAVPPQMQRVWGNADGGSTWRLACKVLWRIISNVSLSHYKLRDDHHAKSRLQTNGLIIFRPLTVSTNICAWWTLFPFNFKGHFPPVHIKQLGVKTPFIINTVIFKFLETLVIIEQAIYQSK
jgi:hypothetical protein